MVSLLHHAPLFAQAELPPGFWEKVWDQGDAFFGAAVVAVGFIVFYMKVVRPDNKAESAARTERSKMELAEAIEKTKQQEMNNEMVRVQREIVETARELMMRFEGNITRHEKTVDRQEAGITKIETALEKLHFSPWSKP